MGANPDELLRQIRAQQPPETPEEVEVRLNAIQRLLGSIDPSTGYEQAIIEILAEQNNALQQLSGGRAGRSGVTILDLPDDVVPLLQEANIRLEEIVAGTVPTTGLPVGLTGTATTAIQNGEVGIGLFDYSGGEYAAEVTADERIDKFDNIRVKRSEGNLVTPISADREVAEIQAPINKAQLYDQPRNQDADLLNEDIRPQTEGSTIRVTVGLDTTTQFELHVIPDDGEVDAFQLTLNESGDLEADSLFEFEFDGDPRAQYNFRCPNDAVTVRQLRVQEILVAN